MKTIVLEEPKNFKMTETPEPAQPEAGEAVVKVHRVGICGTDLSGYLGKMPFYSYPRIPGHELGVEVVGVGEGVEHVAVGDRCSIEPYINCETCYACRKGNSNCCEKLQVLGVHKDGGLRLQFTLPARKLHKSEKLNYEQLALVETLAIGCHAIDRGAVEKGDHVLVIGAGPIGLSVIEFARLASAEITVLDLNAERLAFCREKMGVAHTIQLKQDGDELEQMLAITNGDKYPVVIDATGHNGSMGNAIGYCAHTGKLVYVGITTQEVSFRHPVLHAPEVTLLASRNALPRDFTRIIKLIEDGDIDTNPWITHHVSIDNLIGEFESFTKPETGVIKAIVEVQ